MTVIEKKLAQLRGHIRLMFLSWGLAKVIIWAAGLTLWLYYTDRVLQLPGGVRVGFLVMALVVLAVVAIRGLVYPLSRTLTDEDLALLVEREYPLLNDRLISALQILKSQERYKDASSEEMIKVLVGEAYDLAGRLKFEEAVRSSRLVYMLLGSVLAMGLVFGHAWLDRDSMSIWVRRALGQGPGWPTQTQLDARILEADELAQYPTDETLNVNFTFDAEARIDELGVYGVYEVAMGSDLRVVAEPSGSIPDEAEIRIVSYQREAASGRFVPVGNPNVRLMKRDSRKGADGREKVVFTYNKLNVISPIEQITIKAGDALAGPFTVRVVPPPELDSPVELHYQYPEYLVLPEKTTQETGIEGVAGSRIEFRFSTTKPLSLEGADASALLVDFNVGSSTRLPVDSDFASGANHYRVRLPALQMGMSRWRLRLVDKQGIENARRIGDLMTVREDAPPTVKILFSGDPLVSNQLVYATRDAVIPLEFEMSDDYGVGSARLFWRFADEPEFRTFADFSDRYKHLDQKPQEHVSDTFELDLARLIGDVPLPTGIRPSIQVYVQAYDLNQVKVDDNSPPQLQGSRHNTTLTYELYDIDELRAKVSTQIRQIKTTVAGMLAMQQDLLAATRAALEKTTLLDLRGEEGERMRTDLNDAYQKQNQLLRDAEVVLARFGVFAQVYQFNRLERKTDENGRPQETRIQNVRLLAAIAASEAELQRILNNPLVRLQDAEDEDAARFAGELVDALRARLARALPDGDFSRASLARILQNYAVFSPGSLERSRAVYEAVLDTEIKPQERRELLAELAKQQELSIAALRAIQEQVKKWEGFDDILHGFRNLAKSQEETTNDLRGEAKRDE
ncbi:MAG: hypothetical protein IT463_14495 [Planctomycetes bacterium]|nr:hypothetical protein [Planctomycetota bacterium]